MRTIRIAAVLSGALAVAAPAFAQSPSGRIAFAAPVSGRHTTYAISIVNADGSGLRQLTRPPDGVLDNQPDWSPDGTRIAFERCAVRCAIYTITPDGTGLKRIGPDCGHRKPPACEDRSTPAWSPDGASIAFVRSTGALRKGRRFGRSGQIAHSELSVMDAGGRHVRRITSLTTSKPYSGDAGRPTWSPDGSQLAFGITRSALGTPARGEALFIIGADGKGLRRLTPWKLHAGDHPDFAPDGREILFGAHGPHDRGGNLFSVRPDGSGLTQLTHGTSEGVVSAGSFSATGDAIAFAQLRHGEQFLTSLFVMGRDGSPPREIVRPAGIEHPDWGP